MICSHCGHPRHDPGHAYDGPSRAAGTCDGCEPCRDFKRRYKRWLGWRMDADDVLAELDAEFTLHQTIAATSQIAK